jgi:bile acid:Na+ symporter, BASS family
MALRQLVILTLQLSIAGTLFGFGLKAGGEGLMYLFRRPSLLVRSLVAVLVVMPVLAVVLARVFDFSREAEIALVALSISPVPPLLPRREAKAGGHYSGLALMVVLAVLSIATVPLSLEILQRVFGRPFGAAPGNVARIVMMMTVLPLLAGLGARTATPDIAARLEPAVARVANVLLLLAAVALLAGSWRALWEAVGGGAVVGMVVFAAIGVGVGHLLGGPNPDHQVVLALSTASRHPAIALSIASANFPEVRFAGTILLYFLIAFLVGMPYLAWHRRQTAAAPA